MTGRRKPGGPAKGDRRRQAIRDAVERLLDERTIAQLSVEDIAAAAGISRSGFYFYFENKYTALSEALGDVSADMARSASDFFSNSHEPPEVFVPRALAGVAEQWCTHAALLSAIVDAAHSDDGARVVWDDFIEGFRREIATAIRAERDSGRGLPGPPSADALAGTLLLMNLGVLFSAGRQRPAPADLEETVESLTHVWLASIWGLHRTARG